MIIFVEKKNLTDVQYILKTYSFCYSIFLPALTSYINSVRDSLKYPDILLVLRNVGYLFSDWNNARRGTLGILPPAKLESRHIALTVLMRRKIQPKTL